MLAYHCKEATLQELIYHYMTNENQKYVQLDEIMKIVFTLLGSFMTTI